MFCPIKFLIRSLIWWGKYLQVSIWSFRECLAPTVKSAVPWFLLGVTVSSSLYWVPSTSKFLLGVYESVQRQLESRRYWDSVRGYPRTDRSAGNQVPPSFYLELTKVSLPTGKLAVPTFCWGSPWADRSTGNQVPPSFYLEFTRVSLPTGKLGVLRFC